MAKTVNQAFDDFMNHVVNLDAEKTRTAKSSRDNLISNIKSFSGNDDFFVSYDKMILNFGSFARRTKSRPLDDIDIMLCLSAEGTRTYYERGDAIFINGSDLDRKNGLLDHSYNLNSTKVINRFIKKLEKLHDYRSAKMHKDMEAATLQLKSYEWNFDIVPCFYTVNGFYLIPDGKGNWQKTDPRIDRDRVSELNQKFNGNLLNLIRLIKYWNKVNSAKTIDSYMIEAMVLDRYDILPVSQNTWCIDYEFKETMRYLYNNIVKPVYDPKGIQGDLNKLKYSEMVSVQRVMWNTYLIAEDAVYFKNYENSHELSIKKWKEIFGDEFPDYI